MSNRLDIATKFFDACESGKGWDVCQAYCHADATFTAQADALAEVKTLAAYADWMKGLFTPVPDARYELKAMAEDEGRQTVLGFAVFMGTHTGPGGPVDPTGKAVAADYVYAMQFEGDRIRHMTKIWNDALTLRDLGWA
ncbi:MAG: nuclear transport factor 2 family protein [Pseudomonadota bacterium]